MKFNRLYGGLLMAACLCIGTVNIQASAPPDHAIPNSMAQAAPDFTADVLVNDSMKFRVEASEPMTVPNETPCLTGTLRLERQPNPVAYSEPVYLQHSIPPGYAPRIEQPPLANTAPFTTRWHAAVDCQFKHR